MRPIKFRAIFDGKIETNMSLEGMFSHYENGSCQLDQFTGLHDRTGKPIFESDIVIYPTGLKEQVEFYDGVFNIHWCYGNCEVIGSIHETPELLETK